MALSRGSPRVAVSHHPALWSPDVPRQDHEGSDAAVRPARLPCGPWYPDMAGVLPLSAVRAARRGVPTLARRAGPVPYVVRRTAVLVLLPPSEGKATSGRGRPVEAGEPVAAGATEPGGRAGRAGGAVRGRRGQGPRGTGAEPRAARRDREERGAADGAGRCPAGEIYTGVLYDALDLASLDAAARRRAGSRCWSSPGCGARCGSATGSPRTAARWGSAAGARRAARVLAGADGTVLPEAAGAGSCLTCARPRSGGVEAAGDVAGRTATVRVLHSRIVDGVEKRPWSATSTRRPRAGWSGTCLTGRGPDPRTPAALACDRSASSGFTGWRQRPGPAGAAVGTGSLVRDEIALSARAPPDARRRPAIAEQRNSALQCGAAWAPGCAA